MTSVSPRLTSPRHPEGQGHSRDRRLAAVAVIAGPLLVPGLVVGLALTAAPHAEAAPDQSTTVLAPHPISIPDPGAAPASSIQIPAGRGVVTDVNVTLVDLDHTYRRDLNVTLTGPSGQRATLMHRTGGTTDGAVTITFDDGGEPVPDIEGAVPQGTFAPSVGEGIALLEDAPTSLSVFNGLPAEGTWTLRIADHAKGDSGELAGGWSLAIAHADPVAPAGTVQVADGAARVRTTTVPLGLTAADPAPGTGVTSMRVSNDGAAWSSWRPYAATTTWTLAAGDGTKTVHVQYADAGGNLSAPVSDTVVLDSTGPSVTASTPRGDDVRRRARVAFKASEGLDPATVTWSNVRLVLRGATLKAKVSYRPEDNSVLLTPGRRLEPATTYRVVVSPKVTDLAGNALLSGGKPLRWRFTTR